MQLPIVGGSDLTWVGCCWAFEITSRASLSSRSRAAIWSRHAPVVAACSSYRVRAASISAWCACTMCTALAWLLAPPPPPGHTANVTSHRSATRGQPRTTVGVGVMKQCSNAGALHSPPPPLPLGAPLLFFFLELATPHAAPLDPPPPPPPPLPPPLPLPPPQPAGGDLASGGDCRHRSRRSEKP